MNGEIHWLPPAACPTASSYPPPHFKPVMYPAAKYLEAVVGSEGLAGKTVLELGAGTGLVVGGCVLTWDPMRPYHIGRCGCHCCLARGVILRRALLQVSWVQVMYLCQVRVHWRLPKGGGCPRGPAARVFQWPTSGVLHAPFCRPALRPEERDSKHCGQRKGTTLPCRAHCAGLDQPWQPGIVPFPGPHRAASPGLHRGGRCG
jgi:hypothetical protein